MPINQPVTSLPQDFTNTGVPQTMSQMTTGSPPCYFMAVRPPAVAQQFSRVLPSGVDFVLPVSLPQQYLTAYKPVNISTNIPTTISVLTSDQNLPPAQLNITARLSVLDNMAMADNNIIPKPTAHSDKNLVNAKNFNDLQHSVASLHEVDPNH